MPTRILRDGILTSAAVNALSRDAELFYRRLLSVCDDYGRFEANPSVLRAALYPLRVDEVSAADICAWLSECTKSTDDYEPLIAIYSVDKKRYLQVAKFRQRTRHSKYPEPPAAKVDERAIDGRRDKVVSHERAVDGPPRAVDGPPRATARLVGGEGEGEGGVGCEASRRLRPVSGFSNKKPKIFKAAKAAKTQPVAPPAASPPPGAANGSHERRIASEKPARAPTASARHTPEQLADFRRAVESELGPGATGAEIASKFAEYTAPRGLM